MLMHMNKTSWAQRCRTPFYRFPQPSMGWPVPCTGMAVMSVPPLTHRLAAQDVLKFVQRMLEVLGPECSDKEMRDYLWAVLKSGHVIPGYGHGVLRAVDPRFLAMQATASVMPSLAEDALFRMVQRLARVAPDLLREQGKTKNPNPNVDAGSGVLFHHVGLADPNFYTVIFGVSRALGCMSQLVWARAVGLPIERVKSVTRQELEALCA